MEKEYWHLGTTERCTFRLKPGEAPQPTGGKPDGELFFTDGVTVNGEVFIPLTTFLRELRITRDVLMRDEFLEDLEKIYKREGIFPIQKMDLDL
jgi:hypothetical protein